MPGGPFRGEKVNRFGIRFLVGTLVLTLSHLAALAGVVIHVSPDGDDANDGSSWATAKRTIGAAISAAPSDPSSPTRIFIVGKVVERNDQGDETVVFDGVYKEWLTINAKHKLELYGGFAGTEDTSDFNPPDNDNRSGGETVIDGRELGHCLVVRRCEGMRLDRLSLKNGRAFSRGGGMLAEECSDLQMTSVTVTDCRPYYGQSGGGIALLSCTSSLDRVSVLRSHSLVYGGGLYVSGGSLTASRLYLSDNSARYGGGLCVSANADLDECRIERNAATGWPDSKGGGILIDGGVNVKITRAFINRNVAVRGSALAVSDGARTSASNLIVTNNEGEYATILADGDLTSIDAWHFTIADNRTAEDPLIMTGVGVSRFWLRNSLLAHNDAPSMFGKSDNCIWYLAWLHSWENTGVLFHNDDLAAQFTSEICQQWNGFLNRRLTDDPLAYQILPGSSAIDWCALGEPSEFYLASDRSKGIMPRPAAGHPWPDAGAFEYQRHDQHVILVGWRGDGPEPGDQSSCLLRIQVWNEEGELAYDDMVPQSPDGYYVTRGGWQWEPDRSYSIRISAKNYCGVVLSNITFPAYNSTGINPYHQQLDRYGVLLYGGDLNDDGCINAVDLALLLASNDWGAPSALDVDGDGFLTVFDLNAVLTNFNRD